MKHIMIIILLLGLALLYAQNAPYYPTTTLIENFGASWCAACEFAQMGLDTIESQINPGEVIFTRLLTESGQHSSAEVDSRFELYEVLGFPAVIFNGKIRVNGSDEPVMDGSLFREALNQFRYLGSPLKMNWEEINHADGIYTVNVAMLHDEIVVEDGMVYLYLVEDNLGEGLTRIVHYVSSQAISIAGAGSTALFDFDITPDPAWDLSNLWAVAFVQLPSNTILQAISSEPQSGNQIRVAAPFDLNMRTEDTGAFFSPNFYVYNIGEASILNTSVQVHSAPDDWYVNYCDLQGMCYPGSMIFSHNMSANQAKAFDLNISAGSEGTGVFDFVIESDDAPSYRIPFTLRVGNVSNVDPLVVPATLSIQNTWPNPFKQGLSFQIQNAKAGSSSKITIFNTRGQKVDELPLQNLKEGINQVSWNATDLPSGVYFYRLDGNLQSGKLLKVQ